MMAVTARALAGLAPRSEVARTALRRAVERGGAAAAAVVEVVWACWLRDPSEPVWDLLVGWGHATGPFYVDQACARAATEPDGPLAAFCVAHGLLPAAPPARAAFLVLTGQLDRYRAADPDGTLLATAYAAAGLGSRDRLRTALVSLGDPELATRVVGTARRTAAEFEYLVDQYVGRDDWPRLWELLLTASPAGAVTLARLFPSGWRPSGEAAGRLLDALLASDPDGMAATRRVGAVGTLGPVLDASFAPDGSELAVLLGDPPTVAVYGVPDGARRWRTTRGLAPALRHVLHLGDGTLVLAGGELLRVTETATEGLGYAQELARTDTGFTAVSWSGRSVLAGGATGDVDTFSLWGRGIELRNPTFAAERTTGRVALTDRRAPAQAVVLLGPDGRLLASAPEHAAPGTIWAVAFVGPDDLITAHAVPEEDYRYLFDVPERAFLTRWHRSGDALVPGTVAALMVPVMAESRLVTVLGLVTDRGSGEWFRATDLTPVARPVPEAADAWSTPDGEWLAVRAGDGLDLHRRALPDWAAALVDRPIADLTPADLATVPPGPHPDGAAVVAACVEYRLGTELALGGDPTTGLADIALGDGP